MVIAIAFCQTAGLHKGTAGQDIEYCLFMRMARGDPGIRACPVRRTDRERVTKRRVCLMHCTPSHPRRLLILTVALQRHTAIQPMFKACEWCTRALWHTDLRTCTHMRPMPSAASARWFTNRPKDGISPAFAKQTTHPLLSFIWRALSVKPLSTAALGHRRRRAPATACRALLPWKKR
jgi:hypothetical protein